MRFAQFRPVLLWTYNALRSELVDLNHGIVQRLRLMSQMHAHKVLLEFRTGDRVTFELQEGTAVLGVLTRYNTKSVTVIADDGYRWNVSPRFLRMVDTGHKAQEAVLAGSVIRFKQK